MDLRTEPKITIEVLEVAVSAGWFAAVLKVPQMPLEAKMRLEFADVVKRIVDAQSNAGESGWEVYLNVQELHLENNIRLIAEHGQMWIPEVGIGVYPEAPPLQDWTEIDPMDRDYGTKMPVLKHTVVHLDCDDRGKASACDTMAGMGALVQVLHQSTAEAVQAEWTRTFKPLVQKAFASYPVFLPLLHAASVQGQSGDVLNQWMGAATTYFRESVEDGGLFLLSRRNLRDAMVLAGFLTAA